MTDIDVQPEAEPAAVPELLERGRYAVSGMPDGSWVIARAAPICETCQACGCGEQADPIVLPALAVQAMTGQLNGKGRGMLMRMFGKAMDHG